MSVLAEIVAAKRREVEGKKRDMSLHSLLRLARPTDRKLGAAIGARGLRFILECKRSSPSEGRLRARYDLEVIANQYSDFADAISVLCDGPYFGGSLEDLRRVRERVPQPVLCKDFILDPYQVVEARVHGADAVLLMLSVLDDEAWRRCAAAARELGMDALTEIHDAHELERAVDLGAPIVGINNRDLRTLRVDRETTARLAPRLPPDRLVVCESGIRHRGDVEAVAAHVDAFLVGSSLMRAERLDLATRALTRGRVKVCGLTTPAQARAAWRAGASLGGLIFAPGSPRRVEVEQGRAIAAAAPLPLVGVFLDRPVEEVAAVARDLGLHAVQLHGGESAAYIRALRPRLPAGCEIWKAVSVRDRIPRASDFGSDRLLLDTWDPERPGGTGRRFDWGLLRERAEREELILAGGIDERNVREAMALGCHAVDVNSGVEAAPGVKDEAKIRRLFDALLACGRERVGSAGLPSSVGQTRVEAIRQ